MAAHSIHEWRRGSRGTSTVIQTNTLRGDQMKRKCGPTDILSKILTGWWHITWSCQFVFQQATSGLKLVQLQHTIHRSRRGRFNFRSNRVKKPSREQLIKVSAVGRGKQILPWRFGGVCDGYIPCNTGSGPSRQCRQVSTVCLGWLLSLDC